MRKTRSDRLARILTKAVCLAEEMFPEPGEGEKKKAWVIEFINERVNLPGISERMEEKMLQIVVDVVVALVINAAT